MSICLLEEAAIQKLRSSSINSTSQCVLELVQNSLDALATTIEIHVDVTKYFVQVIDNGTGIKPEDMNQICTRHATSKCHSLEDLSKVRTYGFRGEALANLAEVSELEITSKHSDYYDTYKTIFKGGVRLQNGPTRNNKQSKPGTIIIIRDLFYNYPVRRKNYSDNSLVNEMEKVKRAIETIALIHPQITFILMDASKDCKIISTRKAISNISTFRQIFGVTLAQNLVPVHVDENHFNVCGFFSLKAFHTKSRDELFLDLGSNIQRKSRKNDSIKTSEKYPIFLINLTCRPTDYDICLDPSKNIIEFKNWEKVSNLISNLVSRFLVNNGFSIRDILKTQVPCEVSKNPANMTNVTKLKNHQELPLTFEELAHIKIGGRRPYIFLDEELNVGSINNYPPAKIAKTDDQCISSRENNNFKINENEYIKQTNPFNKKGHYVDLRTGNSYSKLPGQSSTRNLTSSNVMNAKVDRSHLRLSNFTIKNNNTSNETSWAKRAFENWRNPVFKCDDVPMPFLENITSNNNKIFHLNDLAQSNVLGHRFSKKDVENAEVIGQFDDKFIICKFPCSQNEDQGIDKQDTRHLLVIVDQHAADERIRVEMLLKEFCCDFDFTKESKESGKPSFLVQAKPPIKIVLTCREIQVVKRFEKDFNRWGIYFSDKFDGKLDTPSTLTFISPPIGSLFDIDHIQIYITHLPKMISDRCISDSRVMQEIVRQHLYWLEDTGMVLKSDDGNIFDNEDRDWKKMIRKCPRGILDIINSKACRGAIMFNDRLTMNQCENLISRLSLCDFPFQCAHGRPSMIPLIYLDEFINQSTPNIRYFTRTKHFDTFQTVIKSSAEINQIKNMSKFSGWQRRKINMRNFINK
ncbi:760_t:CDS:10 [Diversispora eburnea]|uniref:760_t:CDS:1 n=1 Tax=Diversispora eburnea TaxID=1213867 RepID=A0A9N8YMX9_9GLOM|nr:760_t:CDS:10 [Diversispora eburnea]